MPFHKFAMINVLVLALAGWQPAFAAKGGNGNGNGGGGGGGNDDPPPANPALVVAGFGKGNPNNTDINLLALDGQHQSIVTRASTLAVLDTTTGDVSFIVDAKEPRDIDCRPDWVAES